MFDNETGVNERVMDKRQAEDDDGDGSRRTSCSRSPTATTTAVSGYNVASTLLLLPPSFLSSLHGHDHLGSIPAQLDVFSYPG